MARAFNSSSYTIGVGERRSHLSRIVTTMGIKDGRKLAAPALSAKLSVNMEENEAGAFKALFLACNDVSKKADVNWTAGCKIRTAH